MFTILITGKMENLFFSTLNINKKVTFNKLQQYLLHISLFILST